VENTTQTPDRRVPRSGPGPSAPFSDAEKKQAKGQFPMAFAILGLVAENGNLICPICRTDKRGRVQIKTSTKTGAMYWTCHKCPDPGENAPKDTLRPWGSSAVDFLMDFGGRSYPQAVEELLGRRTGSGGAIVVPNIEVLAAFQAVVDVEVYDHIRDSGSLEVAQKYWARWHIAPEAVAEAGSTFLVDAENVQRDIIERFGAERLRACGVLTVDKHGKDVFLFNRDYPVIEVHQAPSGHVVGMQFRPSPERMKLVAAHKAWKKRWSGIVGSDGSELEPSEAWRQAYEKDQSVGRKQGYVTPFLSLKGGSPDHLVGCGLQRLVEIDPGSTVYIVEGFKDLLSARTMGTEAYAIPGTGVMPPDRSIEILRTHKVVVMLDGDEAGAHGREVLTQYLIERGVDAKPYPNPREGLDITDILVERTAHAGCRCSTCTNWIEDNPYDPALCQCRSCRTARR
jgi:5S rRNA maturation endonuclease (ribonuclease M5)